ncbi:hypothetical protein ACIQWA_05575 [Kitasatospora sp. NPDC098652]|uniref:hypothetical protein n=1 Tax=Kitasatospora sp. NPDC098652 TaxID=3364095 RepID=UPI0038177CCF
MRDERRPAGAGVRHAGRYSTIWLARAVGADDRLEATALQTVGSKGWDDVTVVRRVR